MTDDETEAAGNRLAVTLVGSENVLEDATYWLRNRLHGVGSHFTDGSMLFCSHVDPPKPIPIAVALWDDGRASCAMCFGHEAGPCQRCGVADSAECAIVLGQMVAVGRLCADCRT